MSRDAWDLWLAQTIDQRQRLGHLIDDANNGPSQVHMISGLCWCEPRMITEPCAADGRTLIIAIHCNGLRVITRHL